MSSPLKIHPTVQECRIKSNVICPMDNCGHVFTSESNLNLHLSRTHGSLELKKSAVDKWFFCPVEQCPWSDMKHFGSMKGLRQHYLKVHSEKSFSCISCQRPFATETLLNRHSSFCNVSFDCLDCTAAYNCYDTLKTHCRRKKHRILNKTDYKLRATKHQTGSEVLLSTNEIIPAKRTCSETTISKKISTANGQIQTRELRPVLESKTTQACQFVVLQVTQHTQTGSKNNVCSVETQTVKEHLLKSKQDSFEENYKNINTQTDQVKSTETSCNTSFDMDDFEFCHTEKNSSSTQTHWPAEDIFDISTTTHGSIHTDTSDLLSESLSNFDTNFFNCNSETQTELMFENDIFNSDYYTNMYTQTCDEILSGLNGFNDNETQTVSHETLRSVESQTLMSSIDRICPNYFKDIVHSETQTDAEFRHMLEIINS